MQLRNVSKRLFVAAVALLLPLHASAQSDDELVDEPIQVYDPGALFDDGPKEPDWIPSLRFGLGVNHQGVDSSVRTLPFQINPAFSSNTIDLFCPGGACPEGLVREGRGLSFIGPTRGGNPIDGPSLQGGFEIMGPAIESVLWKPRPFFVLDYRDQLEGKSTTVRDQTQLANNRLVEDPSLTPPAFIPVDTSAGTRRIRVKGNVDQEFWLLAGMGAAFQLPIEGYNVKLKPSLNYFYSKTLIENLLIQPVRDNLAGTFNNIFAQTDEQRVSNHGIAPRIELDAEIYREGPLSVGFFLALDFLVILSGPTKHHLEVNGCFDDGRPPNRCAAVNTPGDPAFQGSGILAYDLKRERLTYQGTAGLRFSWMGGP